MKKKQPNTHICLQISIVRLRTTLMRYVYDNYYYHKNKKKVLLYEINYVCTSAGLQHKNEINSERRNIMRI